MGHTRNEWADVGMCMSVNLFLAYYTFIDNNIKGILVQLESITPLIQNLLTYRPVHTAFLQYTAELFNCSFM